MNKTMKCYSHDDIYEDDLVENNYDFEDMQQNAEKIALKDLQHFENQENNYELIKDTLSNAGTNDVCYSHILNAGSQNRMSLRNHDVITSAYLEIELPEQQTFDDLELTEKYSLFNITFSLIVEGNLIVNSSVLANLFMMICQELTIKSNANIIQIPILDFATIKTCYDRSVKNKLDDDELGLFRIASKHHCMVMCVNLDDVLISDAKFKLKIKGKMLNDEKKTFLDEYPIQSLFIIARHSVETNIDSFNVFYYGGAKAIILHFQPKCDYVEYPKIKSITVINDQNSTYFDSSELLEMELFDIIFFVLPLSKDFASWKNINRLLTNPQKYFSSDMMYSPDDTDKITLLIEYEFKPNDFTLFVNALIPNIFLQIDGTLKFYKLQK